MGQPRSDANESLTHRGPAPLRGGGTPLAAVRAADIVEVRLTDGRVITAKCRPGRGDPLVLLHGLLDSSEGWEQIAMSSPRPTVAFDLPGFGASDLPTAPRISAYAADIVEAIEGLALRRFTLVGHSLGGAVAAAVAELIAQKVIALVLIAPAGFGRIALAEATSIPGVRAVARAAFPLAMRTPFAFDATYRLFVTRGAAPSPELLRRVRRDARAAPAGAALATEAIVAAGRGRRSRASAPMSYRGPVHTLWGASDRVVPPRHAEGVRRAFPQSSFSRWSGMGHHPQAERAAQLARYLESAAAPAPRGTSAAPGAARVPVPRRLRVVAPV